MTARHQERRYESGYEEGTLIYEEEDIAEASALCDETLAWAERVILSADDSPSGA